MNVVALKPRATEEQECIALVDWAIRQAVTIKELGLLFHIPNGAKMSWTRNAKGERYSANAQKMIRMGLKPGVHDYFLPVPRNYAGKLRAGLWIEMKVKGKPLSDTQQWWEKEMLDQGYACATCYTWLMARDLILDYLGMDHLPKLTMWKQ